MSASSTRLDWDDLRLVLAVAEIGTISGAAEALRISHPTLSRRLKRMEERLGTRLFERTPSLCRPTEAGGEVRDLAERMRAEIAVLETRVAGRDLRPEGVVRLTAPDAVSEYLLPDMLAEICRAKPEIRLDLIVSNRILSLAEREADVALRVTDTPDPALMGRRVGSVAMAVFAERSLADRPGERPWVGYDGALACAGPGAWIAAHVDDAAIRFRANTLLGAAKAVRSGIGFGVLPCFVGAALPELVRVGPPLAGLETDLWLVVHADLAKVPRIKAASDALALSLRAAAPRLLGTQRAGA
ncbi:LysR family transcriptional regulator [Pinisolibacter aquiterrae]|uniref:LysR family transcriptional regulator n=1 Tax=Pinisolibacter aquiterrae TaxID=2815579 RepID=UPI001C3D81BB|nr:LysR family transcriptional regulator [Pinisolibacter aquiterrae]MBV5264173.1 LysR family transcriptional regulator [Pinisolibacter aquiterrae]MCC8233733.1 LysR family transcriptional regulator [Pinisolibacter aquiterrae]